MAYAEGRTRESLAMEPMFQDAIVRQLSIIGEAATHIGEGTRARHEAIPWKQVVGMRHRLVHGYLVVDLDVVWATVERWVPELVRILEEALPAEE